GENSTIAGDFGSTVSRYWLSATSSMRAPLSEMLPEIFGLSILMRGVAAIAASRDITTVEADVAGVLDDGAVFGCGVGLLPGVAPGVAGVAGCVVGFCSSACFWVSARCFSICGTL